MFHLFIAIFCPKIILEFGLLPKVQVCERLLFSWAINRQNSHHWIFAQLLRLMSRFNFFQPRAFWWFDCAKITCFYPAIAKQIDPQSSPSNVNTVSFIKLLCWLENGLVYNRGSQPGVRVPLGVHLMLAIEGKIYLHIIYFQIFAHITLRHIKGIYIRTSKNLKVLLKIQWIFVISLAFFIRNLGVHAHRPKCGRSIWSEKGWEPLVYNTCSHAPDCHAPD